MRALLLSLALFLPAILAEAVAAPIAAVAPVPADAGIAVTVTGAVTYKGATGTPSAVTPYMKLRVGDVVEVPVGGALEVLYFGTGRREAWDAGSVVQIAEGHGEAKKGEAKALETGESVGRSLENLPIMLRQAQTYQAGQTLVRGPGPSAPPPLDDVEQAQVAEARAIYAGMRTAAAPADVFPEMYLVSVLLPLGLDAESREALARAVAACPTCPEPKSLLDWIDARSVKP